VEINRLRMVEASALGRRTAAINDYNYYFLNI
jgi:hypothetical protein